MPTPPHNVANLQTHLNIDIADWTITFLVVRLCPHGDDRKICPRTHETRYPEGAVMMYIDNRVTVNTVVTYTQPPANSATSNKHSLSSSNVGKKASGPNDTSDNTDDGSSNQEDKTWIEKLFGDMFGKDSNSSSDDYSSDSSKPLIRVLKAGNTQQQLEKQTSGNGAATNVLSKHTNQEVYNITMEACLSNHMEAMEWKVAKFELTKLPTLKNILLNK
jgi:hypothetical protein